MKKILIALILGFLITGCANKDVKLNLEKVEIELNNLEYQKDGENKQIFNENKQIDLETLQDKYEIDTSVFESVLVSNSKNSETASMYAIFLPKKDKDSEASKEIDKFIDAYSQAWTIGYYPEEEKLVKDLTKEKYGNYHIVVISNDNDKVIEKIKTVK